MLHYPCACSVVMGMGLKISIMNTEPHARIDNTGNGGSRGRDINSGINYILACIGISLKSINHDIQTVFKLTTGVQQYVQYTKQSGRAWPRCGKKRLLMTQRFVHESQKCNNILLNQ